MDVSLQTLKVSLYLYLDREHYSIAAGRLGEGHAVYLGFYVWKANTKYAMRLKRDGTVTIVAY